MMTVDDLCRAMDAIAPTRLAEDWDNVGLLVGDRAAPLDRVLLAIDLTRAVLDEALSLGCTAVIAYHPVIFGGLKRVLAGSMAYELIRHGVAVYSPHTALDVADGGTNDVLADAVEMTARAPLRVTVAAEGLGLGRVGPVSPIERAALLAKVRSALAIDHLLVAGSMEGEVTRVAVGAGACGDLLNEVIASGAGLYVTGEMRHHDALRAASAGVTVACALHSNSERRTLAVLAGRLRAALPGLNVLLSSADRDPFRVAG
ncbi:MAG: Nif3-like dinuclear metal center hexameric protein [Deltaproteobacteria bacterium]|nr:Nif3-like dinuclear metal center hexameric protein [Deltaproteobacteria bacterium]